MGAQVVEGVARGLVRSPAVGIGPRVSVQIVTVLRLSVRMGGVYGCNESLL